MISAFYYLKIIKIVYSPSSQNLDLSSTLKVQQTEQNSLIGELSYVIKEATLHFKNKYEILSNLHSFIIGTLTLSLMLFILNPELLLNGIAIITSSILNL